MSVTNQQILDAVTGVGIDLKALNGRLRESETTQAALVQWRRDHEQVFEDLSVEVRDLRRRQNLWGAALSFGELALATVTATIFGNKGP